jgi:hypothetical protein
LWYGKEIKQQILMASNLFSPDDPPVPMTVAAQPDLDLLPPASLNRPLWRSLLTNLLDRIAPEKLPPLRLTSEPVDVGMLLGDRLEVPWFRTVFSNLGDVISPEVLPPLQLESRPVDVGELLADQVSHPWWTSLAGSLRDKLARDTELPVAVTSQPVKPEMASTELMVPRWSSLLATPKVFLPDKPGVPYTRASAPLILPPPPHEAVFEPELDPVIERKLRLDLKRSKMREVLWIAMATAEILILVAPMFLNK